jgi:hypothetical protein
MGKQRVRALTATFVIAGSLLVAAACVDAGGRIYVRIAPPAPIFEARIVAPGPRYVWVPGYYGWRGEAYVWVAGRWEIPPRPRAVWVSGRWYRDRRGWYFRQGHWR